jgi:hypothetical protein
LTGSGWPHAKSLVPPSNVDVEAIPPSQF